MIPRAEKLSLLFDQQSTSKQPSTRLQLHITHKSGLIIPNIEVGTEAALIRKKNLSQSKKKLTGILTKVS